MIPTPNSTKSVIGIITTVIVIASLVTVSVGMPTATADSPDSIETTVTPLDKTESTTVLINPDGNSTLQATNTATIDMDRSDSPTPHRNETSSQSPAPNVTSTAQETADTTAITYTLNNTADTVTPVQITAEFTPDATSTHSSVIFFPANQTSSVTYEYNYETDTLMIDHDGTYMYTESET